MKIVSQENIRRVIEHLKEKRGEHFTPLESPAIHGGDDMNKTSIPHRKGGVRAPSFLTGFTSPPLRMPKRRC
jgi:hypothetical protein